MSTQTQPTRTHVGRKSNLKGIKAMQLTIRTLQALIAAIAALLIALPAAAAPVAPVIPPELIPIGDVQSWQTSNNMQRSHPLEFKDIVPPAGRIVYAELKATWIHDDNNGIGNERSIVKTSIGDFVCEDADVADPSNSDYICVHEAGQFIQEVGETTPFQISVIYAGKGGWGDSHTVKVEVQFYTEKEGHTTITTTTTSRKTPHLTYNPKTREVTPSDNTPNTPVIPRELPNTAGEELFPIYVAIIAFFILGGGALLRFSGKIAK